MQQASPVTAATTTEPQWRTLSALECPFQIWGDYIDDGVFAKAKDRKQVTGKPITIVETRMHGSVRYGKTEGGEEMCLWGAATKYWAAPALASPAIEGVIVTHDGTAQGSVPKDASHPDVAAARDALAGLAVATLTDHHDVSAPKAEEQGVRGYFVEPRGEGRIAVYWMESGKVVRRDEPVNGVALDCLAESLERSGWRTQRMLRSSTCVFAYRPAEHAAPLPVAELPSAAPAQADEPTSAVGVLGRRKLAANRCVHHMYAGDAVTGDPVTACAQKEPTATVGVFSDEGCVIYFDCAVQAANEAVRLDADDEAARERSADDGPSYTWAILCREHEEQPADGCEECLTESDGDGEAAVEDDGDTEISPADAGCSCPRGESNVFVAHHRAHCEQRAPMTLREAKQFLSNAYPEAEAFQPYCGQGGRFYGYTFRAGRLHSAGYGWITTAGTYAQAPEPDRSAASDVLIHAHRDDRRAPRTNPVMAAEARDIVRRVHADAHTFQVFHRPGEEEPTGWTFRTGYSSAARYGVVTVMGELSSVGLYEYPTTAQRAFLQAELDAHEAAPEA